MSAANSSSVNSAPRRRLTIVWSRRWQAATPVRGRGASAARTRTDACLSMRFADSANVTRTWSIRTSDPKVDFGMAQEQSLTRLRRRTMNLRHAALALFVAVVLLPAHVRAEVSRVEITARRDVAGGRSFGSTGPYEQIVGKLFFAIDPANKRNLVITDLDKAQKNAAGKIEMSADLVILKPRDSSKGNGIALFDIVNRGRGVALAKFDAQVAGTAPPDDYGDGFLLNRGYTIVQVGWEFDARREGAIRAEIPAAIGITGLARATFIPTSTGPEATVGDLVGYTPRDPAAPENMLTVRDSPQAPTTTIPRVKWHLNGNVV